MNPALPPFAYVVLALLAYALITCVLYSLASQRRHAVQVHDLIRESKVRRMRYQELIRAKETRGK